MWFASSCRILRGNTALLGLAAGLVLAAAAAVAAWPRTRSVTAVAVARDGRSVTVVSLSHRNGPVGLIERWDVATGGLRASSPFSTKILAFAFAPDGSQSASGGSDGAIRFHDASSGEVKSTCRNGLGPIYSLAFTPDGRSLAVGSEGGVTVWDVVARRPRWRVVIGPPRQVFAVAVSEDGRLLATADGISLTVWDLSSGRHLPRLSPATSWGPVVFAPKRAVVASNITDRTRPNYAHPVALTDLESGKRLVVLDTIATNCVAFSADGSLVVAGGANETATVWEIASGRRLARFDGHRPGRATLWARSQAPEVIGRIISAGGIVSVAFAPDGRFVVSGGRDGTACVWDPWTGSPFRRIRAGDRRPRMVLIATPIAFSLLCASVLIVRRGRVDVARSASAPRVLGNDLAL